MSKLFVVMEEISSVASLGDKFDIRETYVVGLHLSRTSALEFVKNNRKDDTEEFRDLYVVEAPVVDADEDTYIRLQRSLSRVQNRLGKARKALRQAKLALAKSQESNKHLASTLNDMFNDMRDHTTPLEDNLERATVRVGEGLSDAE